MATETQGAAASEHAQGMPQLDFSTFPNQMFWLVVTLVVIYLVLSRVALPRIAAVLAERRGVIAGDIARAEELRDKAVEAEAAYNKALADARLEAQRIIGETKSEIQKELDAAIAAADAEISARSAESEKKIGAIRDSARESVAEVAEQAAEAIVAKLMPALGEADAKAAVTARMKG